MLADEFIKKEMQDCVNRIAARLDATGTTASGKTRDSLHLEAQEGVYTIFGRDYFSTVETGRKAGKVPKNMTAIIKEWAIAKRSGSTLSSTHANRRTSGRQNTPLLSGHLTRSLERSLTK